MERDTHSKIVGYLLWIFGFTGAHRFYYGKPLTGTLWFFTFGFFLIGWLIDLFLIPSMDREADEKYIEGKHDYSIAWILLTFLGIFGIHRFYLGNWVMGGIQLAYAGLFTLIFPPLLIPLLFVQLYDLFTLNGQVAEANSRAFA
ncbi:TM2 domain-containing protein [Verrucomicrobia bacterium]|nr:TM2 domain-containing protein [Verrucomicrobiota bacterium]